MKKSREMIKVEMMQAAEKAIDELLDWQEAIETPNIEQVENKILDISILDSAWCAEYLAFFSSLKSSSG